jgi:AcrR family transcriptional regulator
MQSEATPPAKYQTPLRAAQREEMRARIVNAARELFHERHYDTTTMDEIAAAAGIRRSTLYLHYRDKSEILLELIMEYGAKAKAILATLPGAPASLTAIRGWVDEIAAFIASERVPLSIIVEVRRRRGFAGTMEHLTNELLSALATNNPSFRGVAGETPDPKVRARALMLLQELTYACEMHLEDATDPCGQALLKIIAEDFHSFLAQADRCQPR